MKLCHAVLFLACATASIAGPLAPRASPGNTISSIKLHSSCNKTLSRQLKRALDDTFEVADVTRNCESFVIPPRLPVIQHGV